MTLQRAGSGRPTASGALLTAALGLVVLSGGAARGQQSIDRFFDSFTDEWMRLNSDAAAASRYFSGEEQDRVERQLVPQTDAFELERITLARRGLAELRRFDRARLGEAERESADLMEW
jgi:hypothetical protein